jgi:hypothetical protein
MQQQQVNQAGAQCKTPECPVCHRPMHEAQVTDLPNFFTWACRTRGCKNFQGAAQLRELSLQITPNQGEHTR